MTRQLLSLQHFTARLRSTRVWTFLVAISLVFALTGAVKLQAQVSSGTLVGSVFDATGAGVPNAKVDVKNQATAVVSTTTTGADGAYRVNNLIAGNYDVTASANGMTTATIQAVSVTANSVVTQNVTLAVGTVSTTVDVSAAATVIDTTTASIQNTFSREMAENLPVSSLGLGVVNLSLLGAGVAGPSNFGIGEGPSVGGQRPYNNNFMIEGVDANNKSITGSVIRTMPNDAVSEFSSLQNQVTAQYGHSSGGQFNTVLKSGTNAFHGTLYEYFQNRNLNAIDQVVKNNDAAAGVPIVNTRFDNNRFGGSIGGPIKKDKLFFFVDYEFNPVGQAGVPSAISGPTAAGYAALAAIPGLSKTNLAQFQKYMPVAASIDPTLAPVIVNGVNIPVGGVSIVAPNYQNNQAAVATMDYSISDKDQLRGRYVWNRLSQIDNNATLPVFFTSANNDYYVASIAEYHNFSAVLNNEFRLGYNRLDQPSAAGNFSYPGLDQFPNITIDELGINIGPDPNQPQETIQNTYQLQDNITWVKGAHTFQFGFDGRRAISPQQFTQRARGDYEYTTLQLFLQDITPDNLAQRSLGSPTYYGDQYATYEYAQDAWRVRKNLTLSLGLRYEYTTVPDGEKLQVLNSISNAPGFLTFGVPQAQSKNFAPRIGVAYSPGNKGNTSIRAGFGMAYDVLYDNIGILSLPPQFSTTVDVSGAGTPNFLANGGIKPSASGGPACVSVLDCRANTSAYVPNQQLPYSIQWNFGVQHVFANNYTFEARYLGTRGVHLDMQIRVNKQAVVTPTNSLPTYLSAPSQAVLNSLPLTLTTLTGESNLVPRFAAQGFTNGAFVVDSPEGWSSYHGLALQLNRRFTNGLQFQGAYTWSHAIDNSTADFNVTALTPRRPQDFQNLADEKASSAFDRRQRFTLAGYYETPWFKHSNNWFMKNLVGNWTAAPIYTYESPEYATVQSAVDSNLNGDSASDRTIINPNGVTGTGSGVTALKNSAGATVAYLANNPNARYIVAGKGAYANGGRNTLPLRAVNNIDVNFLKNFNFKERYKLQFAAQMYNVFNHAQFLPGAPNNVETYDNSLNNGAVARNLLTPGNAIFNNPEAAFSSLPRTIQLSLKLFF